MSGRNDSALYTGANSSSFSSPAERQVKEKQAIERQNRKEVTHKLKPAAEPVLALIEKHKKAAMFVENVAGGNGLTDAEAGQLLRSQRQYYRMLIQFEQELKIVLRDVS